MDRLFLANLSSAGRHFAPLMWVWRRRASPLHGPWRGAYLTRYSVYEKRRIWKYSCQSLVPRTDLFKATELLPQPILNRDESSEKWHVNFCYVPFVNKDNLEYILNKYDKLVINLWYLLMCAWIFEIFKTSNYYLPGVCIFLCVHQQYNKISY